VNIGGDWKLYDVSARDLPANMLSWSEEGCKRCSAIPRSLLSLKRRPASPEASARTRKAKLTLSEDGSIDGEIDLEYSGHSAQDRRSELEGESDARRLERFKDELSKMYPDAEVSGLANRECERSRKTIDLALSSEGRRIRAAHR